MVDSIFSRDYAVVQGLTMVLSCAGLGGVPAVDALQALLDPDRIRRDGWRSRSRAASGCTATRCSDQRAGSGLIAGTAMLLALLACALVPQWIAPYPTRCIRLSRACCNRRWAHPFGTDNFGRDILSRTIWAARDRPADRASSARCSPRCSAPSWAPDRLLRRPGRYAVPPAGGPDVTIPFLVLVIAIVAVLGPGLLNMYIAVSRWAGCSMRG